LKRKRGLVKRARNSEPKRSSKECTFCIRGQQQERVIKLYLETKGEIMEYKPKARLN